jgi:sRNA-binding regulator protein Hfq
MGKVSKILPQKKKRYKKIYKHAISTSKVASLSIREIQNKTMKRKQALVRM